MAKHPEPVDRHKLEVFEQSVDALKQLLGKETHNENAMPDEKSPICTTIREDVEQWIQKEVDKGRFRNRSHGIEFALLQLMEAEKKKASESGKEVV